MKEGRRRIAGCTCARGQARLSIMSLCANMQLPLMPLGTLMPSLFVLCCRDRGGASQARVPPATASIPRTGSATPTTMVPSTSKCLCGTVDPCCHGIPLPTLLPTPPPWRRRTCSPSGGRCCSVAQLQRLLHSTSALLFRAHCCSNQWQYNLSWTLVVTTARHCNIAGAVFPVSYIGQIFVLA